MLATNDLLYTFEEISEKTTPIFINNGIKKATYLQTTRSSLYRKKCPTPMG